MDVKHDDHTMLGQSGVGNGGGACRRSGPPRAGDGLPEGRGDAVGEAQPAEQPGDPHAARVQGARDKPGEEHGPRAGRDLGAAAQA